MFMQAVVKTGVAVPRLVVKLTLEKASKGDPNVVRHLLGLPVTAALEQYKDPVKRNTEGKLPFHLSCIVIIVAYVYVSPCGCHTTHPDAACSGALLYCVHVSAFGLGPCREAAHYAGTMHVL